MKVLILMTILMMSSANAAEAKRVLMIINEGFQIDEYYTPRKVFEQNGYQIESASRWGGIVKPGKKYPASKGVDTDLSFDQIRVDQYDAIVMAGGGGAWSDYFPAKNLHAILAQALGRPKMTVALICAATGLLATANNLDGKTPMFKGRHVTGYFEVEGLLRTQGQVQYESGDPAKPHVVQDGNLITGRDPMSSQLFAETVVRALK